MKKSVRKTAHATNAITVDPVPNGPWGDIVAYDDSHSDRKIAPKQAWEKGFQLVASFLLMGLIGKQPASSLILKNAHQVAWGLPLNVLDHATSLAEALGALYYAGGFAIAKPENQMVVSKSKQESLAFLNSSKTARPATREEIENFLFEKVFSAKLPA